MSKLIHNAASGEILIYGAIGDYYYDGVRAKDVSAALKEIGNKDVTARINSPGGSVFEASAIYSLLASHSKDVHVVIDGAAFSAASFLAMVGKTVQIAATGMMMIHNPWTIAMGDAGDMRKAAEMLDKTKDVILGTYAERTQIDREELSQLLDAETWLTPDEAKEKGFVDSIVKVSKPPAEDSMNLVMAFAAANFKRTPNDWPQRAKTPALDACQAKFAALVG